MPVRKAGGIGTRGALQGTGRWRKCSESRASSGSARFNWASTVEPWVTAADKGFLLAQGQVLRRAADRRRCGQAGQCANPSDDPDTTARRASRRSSDRGPSLARASQRRTAGSDPTRASRASAWLGATAASSDRPGPRPRGIRPIVRSLEQRQVRAAVRATTPEAIRELLGLAGSLGSDRAGGCPAH